MTATGHELWLRTFVNPEADDIAPLEDPAYVPRHPPLGGNIPPVVARWGKASQLRWFQRFWPHLVHQDLSQFWCTSEHHRGPCCDSCEQEYLDGWHGGGVMMDGWCCCRDSRQPGKTA